VAAPAKTEENAPISAIFLQKHANFRLFSRGQPRGCRAAPDGRHGYYHGFSSAYAICFT
jgi:hypothetical protein